LEPSSLTLKARGKQKEDAPENSTSRDPKNKKKKRNRPKKQELLEATLVAATDHKNP
jgi:hypothetical protein